MSSQSLSFGSGNVYAIPSTGDLTPVQFGVLQDVSVDFAFTNKELMGQNQFAVAVARASGKITGKAKAATFSARAFNLVFGAIVTPTTQNNVSAGEAATVPAATTYICTAANAATFLQDLGVIYANTGKAFTKVFGRANCRAVRSQRGWYLHFRGSRRVCRCPVELHLLDRRREQAEHHEPACRRPANGEVGALARLQRAVRRTGTERGHLQQAVPGLQERGLDRSRARLRVLRRCRRQHR